MTDGGSGTSPGLRGWWTPPPGGRGVHAPAGRTVLGWLLVLLWVTFVVLAAATQLRIVTPDRLADDLAEGRVATWRVITLVGSDERWGWVSTPEYGVPAALPNGDVDREQPPLGGREALAYFVDSSLSRMRVVDPDRGDPGQLVAELRQAGVPAALGQPGIADLAGPPSDLWLVPAAALGLLYLAAVLVGPTPTRGNRWFWFWMGGVPLGAGVLLYAVVEGLRPRDPASGPRGGGWTGLFLALVGSVALTWLVTALADGTHWLWVVRP